MTLVKYQINLCAKWDDGSDLARLKWLEREVFVLTFQFYLFTFHAIYALADFANSVFILFAKTEGR
jgi:hypothetical protein